MHKIHVICLQQHNNEFGVIALTQVACSYICVTIAGCNTATSFGSSSPLFLGSPVPSPRVPSPLFLRSSGPLFLGSSGLQSFVPCVPSPLVLSSPVLESPVLGSLGPQSLDPWATSPLFLGSPVLGFSGPRVLGSPVLWSSALQSLG